MMPVPSLKWSKQQVRALLLTRDNVSNNKPQLDAFHLCVLVSQQRLAGSDLPVAKAIPLLSGCLAVLSWLHLFHRMHAAALVRARHQQPILVSGWQSFDNRGQRENTNTMWDQSWWLSCTEMNHQLGFSPSPSSWQGL